MLVEPQVVKRLDHIVIEVDEPTVVDVVTIVADARAQVFAQEVDRGQMPGAARQLDARPIAEHEAGLLLEGEARAIVEVHADTIRGELDASDPRVHGEHREHVALDEVRDGLDDVRALVLERVDTPITIT